MTIASASGLVTGLEMMIIIIISWLLTKVIYLVMVKTITCASWMSKWKKKTPENQWNEHLLPV